MAEGGCEGSGSWGGGAQHPGVRGGRDTGWCSPLPCPVFRSQVFGSFSGPNPVPCPNPALGMRWRQWRPPHLFLTTLPYSIVISTARKCRLSIFFFFKYPNPQTIHGLAGVSAHGRNLPQGPGVCCRLEGFFLFSYWFVPALALSLCEMKPRHMHKQP